MRSAQPHAGQDRGSQPIAPPGLSAGRGEPHPTDLTRTLNEILKMPRGTLRPTFVFCDDFGPNDGIPSFPDWRLLAEGDSWFTVSGIPAYNLLFELRFHKHTQIANCARPGDTIRHISQISANPFLRRALTGGFRWDAILLSGGGNDLIDEADDIISNPARPDPAQLPAPEDYCDQAKLAALISAVQAGYRRIAALRDAPGSPNHGVPVVTHTYDYATPRNAPARFIFGHLGPWLYKALNDSKVPKERWVDVANYLTDKLAEGILALEDGPAGIADLHVVDTRGTLVPADLGGTGDNNDWHNEIHPNGQGYEKLAIKVEAQLEALLIGT
jgi:lysophospholipase L1-like esterase